MTVVDKLKKNARYLAVGLVWMGLVGSPTVFAQEMDEAAAINAAQMVVDGVNNLPEPRPMLPSYWRTKEFKHFAQALNQDMTQTGQKNAKIVVYRLAREGESVKSAPFSLFINSDYQASLLPGGFTVQEVCSGPNRLAVAPDRVDRSRPQELPDVQAVAKNVYYFEAVQSTDGKVQLQPRTVENLDAVGYLQMHTIPRYLPKPCVRDVEKITIGGDGFFAFDRSGYNDIQPTGRAKLADLLRSMKNDFESITIVRIDAYTDRFGSVAYNARLSQARANTVLKYFEDNGIKTLSDARGMGSTNPQVFCPGPKTKAVTDCLYPNRRMEIFIEGIRKQAP